MNLKSKLLIIITFLFTLHVFSQAGVYNRGSEEPREDGTIIQWTITLNQDGTFLYHFLRVAGERNPEENFYGKGTWKIEGKVIMFFSKEDDLNQEFTVNLNNSKARYITKSPRDKSDKVVKTALRFYESETSHIVGLTVYKE
ncbi:copper resistance protein NlpE N-terminal domain-containing protein [Cognatitamlana onchidii]|uniref:copper resistance protein NlpE N-terminal domain-containing protein n=1 Tax=Cognatitamlana onchidii TaxID=2562860 RepID=UPI0010A60CC9|nr:copper resistance protein NlpE N-terminal domain-containing protein [Algibacter onchidii]